LLAELFYGGLGGGNALWVDGEAPVGVAFDDHGTIGGDDDVPTDAAEARVSPGGMGF